MLTLTVEISELIGVLAVEQCNEPSLHLLQLERIRRIRALLALGGDGLSGDQIAAVLEGRSESCSPLQAQAVLNACAVYEAMPGWRPGRCSDLLAAHECLMCSLTDDAGRFRHGFVEKIRVDGVVQLAPSSCYVDRYMQRLLARMAACDLHPLVKSCLSHYDFVTVRPFTVGSTSIGLLWQSLILIRWRPLLSSISLELAVYEGRDDYYAALAAADESSSAVPFVEYMLELLHRLLLGVVEGEGRVKLSAEI